VIGIRELKRRVLSALSEGDTRTVTALAKENIRTLSVLINLSYDKNSLSTWRAIEAMGPAVAGVLENSHELGRNIVRRLLWSVTEESGGLGWSAIEMIGEIVRASPGAFSDIVLLIPQFFEDEIFKTGVLHALCRIGSVHPELIEDKEEVEGLIVKALRSGDPAIRGYGLFALKCLGTAVSLSVPEEVPDLLSDEAAVRIYASGDFRVFTIRDLAEEILKVHSDRH